MRACGVHVHQSEPPFCAYHIILCSLFRAKPNCLLRPMTQASTSDGHDAAPPPHTHVAHAHNSRVQPLIRVECDDMARDCSNAHTASLATCQTEFHHPITHNNCLLRPMTQASTSYGHHAARRRCQHLLRPMTTPSMRKWSPRHSLPCTSPPIISPSPR
jgi:hypothetical protein